MTARTAPPGREGVPAGRAGGMRPVFVGGCPRSGTTLLGGLLGAHSRCLCVPEMQFKRHLYRKLDWTDGRMRVDDLIRWVRDHWRFRVWESPLDREIFWDAWKDPPPEAVERDAVTYPEAVKGLVRVYAAAVGKEAPEVWVDHTPGNTREGNALLDCFPDARFVHIVRDGRAIAASVIPLCWGPNHLWKITDWWPQWLGYGLALERRHPERVTCVRYEDLVREPRTTLAALCRRLDLEEEPHLGERAEFRVPRWTRAQHELVSRPPDPSRAEAWREALTPRQVEIFESSGADLLRSFGYPLEFGDGARRPTPLEKLRGRALGLVRAGVNNVRWRRRMRRARWDAP